MARAAQAKLPERTPESLPKPRATSPAQRPPAAQAKEAPAAFPRKLLVRSGNPGGPVVQRADDGKAQPAEDKPKKEAPPKQKILDLRPKVQGDPNPLSNYEAWIPVITNASTHGINTAPIVYVMNGWHRENPDTPIERLHFDISLDGATRMHVYHNPQTNSVSIG